MLVEFFNAVSNVERLKMLGLMSDQPYEIRELAIRSDLPEWTVREHLKVLRQSGLISLSTDRQRQYYRLNTDQFVIISNKIEKDAALAQSPYVSEEEWHAELDELDMPADDIEIIKNYTRHGKLFQIPTNDKKFLIILRWLGREFSADTVYTEADVNQIISKYHPDYAQLRHYLVHAGILKRKRDGSQYWVAE